MDYLAMSEEQIDRLPRKQMLEALKAKMEAEAEMTALERHGQCCMSCLERDERGLAGQGRWFSAGEIREMHAGRCDFCPCHKTYAN